MIETARAYEWLYALLSGDTVLQGYVGDRIYRQVAPEGATLPFIVFQVQSGHDMQTAGPYRVMTTLACVVKAVGLASDYLTLRAIADRVDELLQAASGTVTDARVLACFREIPLDYDEVDAGVRYQHLGGQYRLYIHQM